LNFPITQFSFQNRLVNKTELEICVQLATSFKPETNISWKETAMFDRYIIPDTAKKYNIFSVKSV